ncbi:MAG: hypothetical protein SFX73_39040 [Kofleriaceae bacterium]|nr:hypothetical protein [Kofleriaceae bacterium]
MASGGELEVELALDRVEAQLASELPSHIRAFAAAYAAGKMLPAAPELAGRASTVELARRALVYTSLRARGLALLRLAVPLAIERDKRVLIARAATPSWDALAELVRARDAVARAQLGRTASALTHALHGALRPDGAAIVPPAMEGWSAVEPALPARAVDDAWRELAWRHDVRGTVRIVRAEVRPRAFVVEAAGPRAEVIVVVPMRVDSPAARFAVLHELGHALAHLASPPGLPRAVDEAVASYAARLLEEPASPWYSSLAAAARARRGLLAHALDIVEDDLGTRGHAAAREVSGVTLGARPPWALWHDPGAQALYVEAERISQQWWTALGPSPAPGALAAAIATERARIDQHIVI